MNTCHGMLHFRSEVSTLVLEGSTLACDVLTLALEVRTLSFDGQHVPWIVSLFADDLDHHPLVPPAVEFAVEDLFPGAEVQLALRDGNHDLASHDLPLVVSIAI